MWTSSPETLFSFISDEDYTRIYKYDNYYGEGKGATMEKAPSKAVESLLANIASSLETKSKKAFSTLATQISIQLMSC